MSETGKKQAFLLMAPVILMSVIATEGSARQGNGDASAVTGVAVVKAMDRAKRLVTVRHAPMVGMPSEMTMTLTAAPEADLGAVAVGDVVILAIAREADNRYLLSSVTRAGSGEIGGFAPGNVWIRP